MKSPVKISTILLILTAAVVGVVVSESWRIKYPLTTRGDVLGYQSDGIEEFIASKYSLNDVRESTHDRNDNGQIDNWVVSIRRGEDLGLYYSATDTNGDGLPDMLHVRIGKIATGYTLRDDDADGIPDLQVALLSNLKEPEEGGWFSYYDIDMDGKIDMMVLAEKPDDPTPLDNHVRMGERWVAVIAEMGGNFTDGLYIHGSDGKPVHIIFDFEAGEWEVASTLEIDSAPER